MSIDERARLQATGPIPVSGSGITYRETEDGAVVAMWGEIDTALRDAEAEVMNALTNRPEVSAGRAAEPAIIIDTKDVTFIDSSAVAFFLRMYALGQRTGVPVCLRDPADIVVEVLDMVGIGDRLPVIEAQDR